MKSMTGYGRGECAGKGYKVVVEASSVNRKQLEQAINLPREIEALEPRVRDEVNRLVSRGRVTVKVVLHAAEGGWPGRVTLNLPLARAYTRELQRMARELKLPGQVGIETLMRAPGILRAEDELEDADSVWPPVEKALRQALSALIAMREREGAHLARDLQKRVDTMRKAVSRVQKQAPEVLKRFQEQLRERIKNSGIEPPVADDERLLKEVVYFADRSDITEELTRLQSHFQQFGDCVKSTEPVGRTLDFLAQEMNREVNTIGSKANDSQISREVVGLKTELERFREQVQNVE